MSRLERRLAALEAKLPRPTEMRGAWESHFTQGGGADEGAQPCTEDHGDQCAVQVMPVSAPIRRIIVLDGPWDPIV